MALTEVFPQFLALVSGYEGTCVWWENVAQEGFASLDISPLKSSSKKCYKNSAINSKPFYLSIPSSKVVPVVEFLKVSQSRRQSLKCSFEPKTELLYFCISALAL